MPCTDTEIQMWVVQLENSQTIGWKKVATISYNIDLQLLEYSWVLAYQWQGTEN